jgi:hypothetical protein
MTDKRHPNYDFINVLSEREGPVVPYPHVSPLGARCGKRAMLGSSQSALEAHS